ncbi:hypothetical protein Btru_054676 [Bulinus truncatus]|nr:hypothetical protein Btru_054676 [Bulinus truncatus]
MRETTSVWLGLASYGRLARCARLSALKKKNPAVEIIVVNQTRIGGRFFFFIMYRDSKLRSELIQAAINFVRLINFDGEITLPDMVSKSIEKRKLVFGLSTFGELFF